MKKLRVLCFALTCALFVGSFASLPAQAGRTVQISKAILEEGELNQTDWYFADSNIVSRDGTLVVPAETSTSDTRFIAKAVSKADETVTEMTNVDAKLRITALPSGQKFMLAFGLGSIEAFSGQNGNVEMVFSNEGGIVMSIVAYTEAGAETVMEKKNCGVSLNKDFTVDAGITPKGVLTVTINNQKVCEAQLPVSGVGRFGVLQSGSCGAQFSELSYGCSHYESPENTNIDENFDDGEFNINELYSTSKTNGLYPSAIRFEDIDGNMMLRFQNCGLSHIGTKYKYSNFEISFDMPYFLRENVYDENGVQIGKPSSNIGVSFGSEAVNPEGYTYVHDIDLITIRSDSVRSEVRRHWSANLVDMGIVDLTNNEGYSFKLSVVDGHSVCQVKKVTSDEWITIGECDYELQRSGYIYIWSTGNADCAIDNLKITNLDANPNTVEAEYKSSVVTAEDYELTEEEKTLTFREVTEEKEEMKPEVLFVVCCAAGAVVLAVIGIVTGALLKRKKTAKEVKTDEKI